MLDEYTLFGHINKIKEAKRFLKENEPDDGYYLAFSGGKDSLVVKSLCETAKVKFDAHYNLTTIDPPELVYYIRKYHPDVNIHKPVKNFFQEMLLRGFPTRQRRWCCDVLKEKGGYGRIVLTGVRKQEGLKRGKRKRQETCKKINKELVHPIIHWSKAEVWEYIKRYRLKYCELYKKGFDRIGCILCPLANDPARKLEAKLYPRYVNLFRLYFNRLFNKNQPKNPIYYSQWKNGDELFDWWMMDSNKLRRKYDQPSLFD